MDMQNVSNLQIPEGVVRTIHDKDNRLIWGRVNYDTKYAGNTAQDGTPTPDAPVPVQTVTGEQTVTISDGDTIQTYPISLIGKNLFDKTAGGIRTGYLRSDGTISGTEWRITDYIPIKPNTPYTTSGMASGPGNNPSRCYYDENKTYISGKTHSNNNPFINTSPAGAYYMRDSFQSGDLDTLQVEEGSQASTYAPYYNYELCKIDNYQDYIYKSGDDWYVHKEFATRTIDANTAYTSIIFGSANTIRISYSGTLPKAQPEADGVGISPYLQWKLMWSKDEQGFYVNGTTFVLRLNKSIVGTTEQNFLTWLASNPLSFYYAIETPTNTKITDATLISQLEAIDEWMTRYGYTSVVSGNLPIMVDRTNL